MLISVEYSVSGIKSYFSCSKTPKVRVNNSSEFFDSSKLVRMGENV